MGRNKEIPQGMVDAMSDERLEAVVRKLDEAKNAQDVADVADTVASIGERWGLDPDEVGVLVRMAQAAIIDSGMTAS